MFGLDSVKVWQDFFAHLTMPQWILLSVFAVASIVAVLMVMVGSAGIKSKKPRLPILTGEKPDYARYKWMITTALEFQYAFAAFYYDLCTDIKITVSDRLDLQALMNTIEACSWFHFHKTVECEAHSTESGQSQVRIKVEYKQYFRILRAICEKKNFAYLNKEDQQVYNKIDELIKKLTTPAMPPYKKELAVYDYLLKEAAYDYENFRKKRLPESAYTPYGILFRQKGVCQGFAETFMLFMTALNIPCCMVEGTANGISSDFLPHVWNMVKLGGQYYHVDVTFDNHEDKNHILHAYFNVTDQQISKDHKWTDHSLPKCSSDKFEKLFG